MRTKTRKPRLSKSLFYPLIGFLLSFGVPLGWFAIQIGERLSSGFEPFWSIFRSELASRWMLYVYMLSVAMITLTLSGLAMGIRDDRLRKHYNRLLSQRRLLAMKNRQLARLSNTDRLTGLANYFRLHEILDLEYKRARRYNLNLCVMQADVDHFKEINDTYGHLFGDYVLHELGQIFATNQRETDFVGRSGGEEFCFILTETDMDHAIRFGERVRETVANYDFTYEGRHIKVTLSTGIASIADLRGKEDLNRGDSLLSLADQALYEAKRKGRNRVERFRSKPKEVPAVA